MDILKNVPNFTFTSLHARIIEEDGAFTVRVRMLNRSNQNDRAWGEEIASSIDMASAMIESIAKQYSIPPDCISIKIVMDKLKDGTLH